MSDRDASLDEASNIAFKALKEKPPAKPVDLYYARILLFTAVFEQSVCVLCKISFIFFKVYSVGTPMPMLFVPIKITRFFGFMFKALHSSLSIYLSLSAANKPAPIAPKNSGLSDMKIFEFNRFCNTFFKTGFRADEIVPLGLQLNLKIA